MPKMMRQVEQEVSVDELLADLKKLDDKIIQDGVYLVNADGTRGEKVRDGDVLIPSEETYKMGIVAPETYVNVIRTADFAGLVWCSFHRPDGAINVQFFIPQAFVGKYARAKPVKKAKK